MKYQIWPSSLELLKIHCLFLTQQPHKSGAGCKRKDDLQSDRFSACPPELFLSHCYKGELMIKPGRILLSS